MYKIQFPKELKPYCIDINDVKIKEKIAAGGFGCVNEAIYQKKKVAIKIIKKEMNDRLLRRFISEVCSLYRCHHPFIEKFIGFTNKEPYSIITELVSNTNLLYFICERQYKKKRTGTTLTRIAMGIASAVAYIHSINIMHRDLKPENILLDDDFYPKICDFGLVREFNKPSYPTFQIGTKYWMAPEVIRCESQYDEKCDVFSYAMILYQMVTGELPYPNLENSAVLELIADGKRPEIPSDTPTQLRKLIKQCWSDNPHKRPSFEQIYEKFANGEVYFNGTDGEEIEEFASFIAGKTILPSPNPVIYKRANDDDVKSQYSLIPFENSSFSIPKLKKKKNGKLTPIPIDSGDYKPVIHGLDDPYISSGNSSSKKGFKHFKLHTQELDPRVFDEINCSSDDFKAPVVEPKYREEKVPAPSIHYHSSMKGREDAPELATPSIDLGTNDSSDDDYIQKEQSFANLNSPYYSSKKTLNMTILKDTRHPLFSTELQKIETGIPRSQAKSFLKIACEHFRAATDVNALKEILVKMVDVVQSESAIKEFEALGFKSLFPYEENELIDPILDVLSIVFKLKPSIFQYNFKQQMKKLIVCRPEKALVLLSLFAEQFDYIEDPWELLDLLLKKESVFFSSDAGSSYVSLLYYLLKNYKSYYESRIDVCRTVLVNFISSSDEKAAIEAYKAVANLYDKKFVIPYEKVIVDLKEKELSKHVLSLLIRVKNLPAVEEFVFILMKLSRTSEKAALIVMKLLSKPDVACSLAEASNWLVYDLPTKQVTLSFFILIMKFKTSKSIILKAPEVPLFFTELLKSGETECVSCLSQIFDDIEITKEFFKSLKDAGFFNELFKLVVAGSKTCKVSCMETCAVVLKSFFIKDAIKLIPVFIDFFNEDPRIAKAALKVCVGMSYYPKAVGALLDARVEAAVKKAFKDNKSAKKYADELRANILAFNK